MTKMRSLLKTKLLGGTNLTAKKEVTAWKEELNDILVSKAEEFQLLDYSKANTDDLWNCLQEKVWKGNPEKALHEMVQDIYHLSPNVYMTYLTQQSLMAEDLKESLAALLGNEQK